MRVEIYNNPDGFVPERAKFTFFKYLYTRTQWTVQLIGSYKSGLIYMEAQTFSTLLRYIITFVAGKHQNCETFILINVFHHRAFIQTIYKSRIFE